MEGKILAGGEKREDMEFGLQGFFLMIVGRTKRLWGYLREPKEWQNVWSGLLLYGNVVETVERWHSSLCFSIHQITNDLKERHCTTYEH